MALNPKYVALAIDFQVLLRNKLTGLPLRNGYIEFYQDNDRITPKTVYKISGDAPNYSFTAIGSTVNLTGIGSFSDNDGNDIVPYGLPYESESSDIVELYFIRVFDEEGNEQFTREAWPPGVSDSEDSSASLVNYIPNGQFLLHHDLPADSKYDAGEIRDAVTDIAQGGWTFERPEGATSTDFVTFERFGGYTTNPTSSPRYSLRVVTESTGGGVDYKDVRIKFLDVNKFASATQQYTISITAKTNSGSSASLLLYYIKNYGTGLGVSPQEEKEIGQANLSATYQVFNFSFVFGANTGKTIGSNNDDFVQLAIRYPVDELFDISIDNAVLAMGEVDITTFPVTPDADFLKSLPGVLPVPAFDNSNLYLPLMLGPQGYVYDTSVISKVRTSSSDDIDDRVELKADGAQYETAGYSSHGVPYSRLQTKYWNSTYLVPKHGTGAEYALAVLRTGSNIFGLHANTAGSVTATADGSAATGFTFETVATGAATYYTQAAWLANTQLLLQNLNRGAVTATTANTSTFTISQQRKGSTLLQEITSITCVAASALADAGNPAKYFKFFSYNAGAQEFYVWYQVTNETDPTGGGTGIKIKLNSADTATIVAQKTANVLNGWQTSVITATAASAITAGSFWTFNSTTTGYYVWYKKDGAGTDPAPVGRTGIQVDIVTADTNILVASKTITAINEKYFAVPNYYGMYLQGIDPTQIVDRDTRWSLVDNITGMALGTYEYDANVSHDHPAPDGGTFPIIDVPGGLDISSGGSLTDTRPRTGFDGSYNTRPRNAVVNFYIRY